MNEHDVIEILWKFIGWTLASLVALVGVIFAGIRGAISRIYGRIDMCALREEVAKVERDLKDELRDHRNERLRRDDKVDETLSDIKSAVTDTHRRMDDLYRAMVNQQGGGR